MPKCPMCEKEVDHLVNKCVEKATYNVILDRASTAKIPGKDELFYDYDNTELVMDVFVCPECGRPICLNEKDALIFLRG